MHYLALLRGTQPSGRPPAELIQAIGKLGIEATNAGVLLDTGGVLAGAPGARVALTDGKPTATDGPSAGSADLVGYALYEVSSKAEVIGWTNRFLQLNHDLWPGWQGETDLIEVFRQKGS